MPKRILIAESNAYLAETFTGLLTLLGFEVVGVSPNQSDIIDQVQTFGPDLLVLDYDMERGDDKRPLIGILKEKFPHLKIVALGLQDAIEDFTVFVKKAGYDGFWSKYASREELLKALNLLFP